MSDKIMGYKYSEKAYNEHDRIFGERNCGTCNHWIGNIKEEAPIEPDGDCCHPDNSMPLHTFHHDCCYNHNKEKVSL